MGWQWLLGHPDQFLISGKHVWGTVPLNSRAAAPVGDAPGLRCPAAQPQGAGRWGGLHRPESPQPWLVCSCPSETCCPLLVEAVTAACMFFLHLPYLSQLQGTGPVWPQHQEPLPEAHLEVMGAWPRHPGPPWPGAGPAACWAYRTPHSARTDQPWGPQASTPFTDTSEGQFVDLALRGYVTSSNQ